MKEFIAFVSCLLLGCSASADVGVALTGGSKGALVAEAAPNDGDFDFVVALENSSSPYSRAAVNTLISDTGKTGVQTVLVRPVPTESVTVNWDSAEFGSTPVSETWVTFYDLEFNGNIQLVDGTTIWLITTGSSYMKFDAGADNITIRDSFIQGGLGTNRAGGCTGNVYRQNDVEGTDWLIKDNTFKGFANRPGDPSCDGSPPDHSEALFIGEGSTNWVIEDNIFDQNGTTAHIFHTWWSCGGSWQTSCNHVNVCVKNNTFSNTHNNFGIEVKVRDPEFSDLLGALGLYYEGNSGDGGSDISPSSSFEVFPWLRSCL